MTYKYNQGCGAVIKMILLQLKAPGVHVYSSSSRAIFFHNTALTSVRFYTLIFLIILVYLKLTGKRKIA